MQTNRRGAIVIVLVMLALVAGVVVTVLHFRSDPDIETGGTIGANNTSQSAPAAKPATPTPAPAPSAAPAANTPATTQPSQLANTGPGAVYLLSFVVFIVAGFGHYVFQRFRNTAV